MFGPFKLKSTLGRSNTVDLDDVIKTKQVLQNLGYYKPPKHGMNPYPEHELFKSIERFQSEHGLLKDGVIRPGGQTERTLHASLGIEHTSKDAIRVDTVAVENAVVATRYAVALEAVVLGRGNRHLKNRK